MVLDETLPELVGVGIAPLADIQPMPNPDGHNSASFRFWQVKRLHGDEPAVDEVLKAVIPESHRGRPAGEANTAKAPRGFVTIVEASTVLVDDTESGASDAFDECLAALQDLLRGYGLATHHLLPLITRESLPPLVIMSRRTLFTQVWDQGLSAMMVNLNVPPEFLQQFDAPTMKLVMGTVSDIRRGHPLVPYREAGSRARRALVEEGNYQDAVIYREMGVEILIDALLTLLLWEEGKTSVEAANAFFVRQLPWRIEHAIASRLGGDWKRAGTGPIGLWESRLAFMRGRVVHGGYRPTLQEAREAVEIGSEIDKLVRARLAISAATYPKTAMLILAEPGLRRLNGWTRRVQTRVAHYDEASELSSYSAWRHALDSHRINLIR